MDCRFNNFTRLGVIYTPEERIDLERRVRLGVCESCGRQVNIRQMQVDHSHTANILRGVICGSCNKSLGMMEENPEYLQKLIDYIQKFS